MLSYKNIISLPAEEVAMELAKEVYIVLPVDIDNLEEMKKAGSRLGEITNKISYYYSILIMLRILVRQEEKNKNIERKKDMIGRRDIVEDVVKAFTQQYVAVSRQISTYQGIQKEMDMY